MKRPSDLESLLRNEHSSKAARVGDRGTPQLASISGVWRQDARQLDDFASLSAEYFWEMDANFRYCFLSDNYTKITGIPARLAHGMTDKELGLAEDFPGSSSEYFDSLFSCQSFRNAELTVMHHHGRDVVIRINADAISDQAGNFAGFRGSAAEVNPVLQPMHTHEEQQSSYKHAGRIPNVGFWEWDEIDDCCTYCSEELARIHGVSVTEFLRLSTSNAEDHQFVHVDDRQRYEHAMVQFKSDHQSFEIEYRLLQFDGKVAEVTEVVAPIFDSLNELVRSFGFVRDATDRNKAAASLLQSRDSLIERVRQRTEELQNTNSELLESKSRLSEATRIAKLGYYRWNSKSQHGIYRDEEVTRILGVSESDCSSETTQQFLQRIHPEDRDVVSAHYKEGLVHGTPQDLEYRIIRPDGGIRYLHERSTSELNEDGTVLETFGTVQDISERKAMTEELAKVEERLFELGAAAREVLYVLSADWREVIYVSKAFETIWGHSCEALIEDPRLWISSLHPADQGQVFSEIESKMNGSDTTPDFSDARVVGTDGQTRWLSTRVYPVRDKNGVTVRFAGVAEDITERKTATDVLHHAQKMDALGQLTGGVAHDFNNLLAVILGNTELLLSERTEDDSEILHDVLSAGRRAADLTKRLLAFSRLQPMQPKPVDVGALVSNLSGLLQRTLGMTISVRITSVNDGSLVFVDPGLLENAMLNLVLNSRDAMPGGGTLRIFVSAPQDRSGTDHLAITVHDDGIGMEQQDLARALEPFFTTKRIGEGSGLGLSMVYGFVKQSKGDLEIDSQFGEGTTVSIFLPCSNEPEQ